MPALPRSLGVAALGLLLGCALPPLPPLHAAWRPTPDDEARRVPPGVVPWQPAGGWSDLHRGVLPNGLAVYVLQRPVAGVGVTLVSPGAGLQEVAHSRAVLFVASQALTRSFERPARPDRATCIADFGNSDRGGALSVAASRGGLALIGTGLRDALRGDGVSDAEIVRARGEATRLRRDGVGLVETLEISLRQQMFGEESPAARPAFGYSDEITRVAPAEVRAALTGAFLTTDSALVVTSALPPGDVVAVLGESLGGVALSPRVAPRASAPALAPRATPVTVVPAGGTQATLVVGCPLGSSGADDVEPQQALSALLGADLSSHFAELVRNERGLSYDFNAEVRRIGGHATLFVVLTVDAPRAGDVLEIILAHLGDLARDGLPGAEARRAVLRLQQRRIAEWDDAGTVGMQVAFDVLRGAAPHAPTRDAPDAAAAAAVRLLADRCAPERLGIALAGDPRLLMPVAELDGRPAPRVLYWRPTLSAD